MATNRKTVLAKLSKIKELSTPPMILQSVLNLVNSPDSSAKDLAEVILRDPALTARVLRVANSSFYGYYKKVATVHQAVMIMGLNAVKYFILSITVLNQLSNQKNNSKINHKYIWAHFLEVACAAKNVAAATNYNQPEEAYVAGLLHDIGIILLEYHFPEEYKNVLKLVAKGKTVQEAECEIFGLDHQEVGGYLTNFWNMPAVISDAISKHHINNESEIAGLSEIAKIVALADCMANVPFDEMRNLYNAEKRLNALNNLSINLRLNSSTIIEIHKKLATDVVGNAATMDLDVGDAVEILSRSNTELFNIYLELASLFRERRELSKEILREERMEGTLESLKIALATLSHYINNSTMNIQGKCEMLKLLTTRGDAQGLTQNLPVYVDSMQKSVQRITLVLEELSNISSVETLNFFSHSQAIDIEKNIKSKLSQRLESLEVIS
jgi:putative nucleotidyltransferase with HDIG domain